MRDAVDGFSFSLHGHVCSHLATLLTRRCVHTVFGTFFYFVLLAGMVAALAMVEASDDAILRMHNWCLVGSLALWTFGHVLWLCVLSRANGIEQKKLYEFNRGKARKVEPSA